MKPVQINGFRFAMNLGPGYDSWLPFGEVSGHPGFRNGECIFTSSPVDFDEETLTMTTASGRVYEIKSFEHGNFRDEKWIAEIKEEVAKNKAILAKKQTK